MVRARGLTERVSRRFITYLELMQPQEGETPEELDVQVEVDVIDEPPDDNPDELRDAALLEGAEERTLELSSAVSPSEEGPDIPVDDAEVRARLDDAVRRLTIPDDPTVLSYLLSGIVQVELPRRQALLEAPTTEERLEALGEILEREIELLRRRLRNYRLDGRLIATRRN